MRYLRKESWCDFWGERGVVGECTVYMNSLLWGLLLDRSLKGKKVSRTKALGSTLLLLLPKTALSPFLWTPTVLVPLSCAALLISFLFSLDNALDLKLIFLFVLGSGLSLQY